MNKDLEKLGNQVNAFKRSLLEPIGEIQRCLYYYGDKEKMKKDLIKKIRKEVTYNSNTCPACKITCHE